MHHTPDRAAVEARLHAADAVLFDFDGVLADSEPVFFAACRDAFAARGHALTDDVFYDRFASQGLGVAGEVARAGLAWSDADVADVTAAWLAGYRARCARGEARLFPGALELVARVAARKPTAIASSSTPEQLHAVLSAAGVSPACPVIGRVDGLRKKPAPDVYAYAAGALGVAPSRCVAFEDTAKGLAAARALGMDAIAIRTRYTGGPGFDGVTAIDRDVFTALWST